MSAQILENFSNVQTFKNISTETCESNTLQLINSLVCNQII